MNQAIGLVEVKGLASAIEVSDTMVKVANVELLGVEKAKGFGWMTVKVAGDVGAVKAAVDAGKAKAVANNVYLSALVIPRPANNLEKFFFAKEQKASDNSVESVEETPPMVNEPVEMSPGKVEAESKTDEKSVIEEPTKAENIKEEAIKKEPIKEKPIKTEQKKKKNPPRGSKKSSDSKKK